MYESFYGFSEKPFNLTPDPKFVYLSPKHQEAFAHLEFGLRQRGGFIVLTGEVGTGKTTLCRYFLERLDDDTVSAFILYPALGTTELLRAINRDLGVRYDGASDKELIDALHVFLLESREAGKNIVLVIDEAQNLSRDVLEQVRLISNLETHTEKLIQIVLLGQSELNEMLGQKDLRQLAQRVTARYHLTPLSRAESDQYVRHRLAVAGGIMKVEFTDGALNAIYRFSGGIPRLINLVCDRSLLAGYVLEKTRIGPSLVRRAARELALPARPWLGRLTRMGWASAAAALALPALVSLALLGRSRPDVLPLELPAWLTGREAAPTAPADEADAVRSFGLRLLTLSRELSSSASAAVLLEQWGFAPETASELSVTEDMAALAERVSLEYAELDTTVAQLGVLNLPAVLEVVHPSRDESLYVALTRLEGETATIQFSPGDEVRVPLDVLRGFWSGRARFFWRDFDRVQLAGTPERLAWARSRLVALGLLPAEETGAAGIESAVRALQEKLHLEPDGELGHKTQMALYSLAGGYRTPQLRTP